MSPIDDIAEAKIDRGIGGWTQDPAVEPALSGVAEQEPHDAAHPPSRPPDAPAAEAVQPADQATHAADGQALHAEATAPAAEGKSKVARALDHYLDLGHLFGHVQDSDRIELPFHQSIPIPNPLGYTKSHPLVSVSGQPVLIGQFTKFMALELAGAVLLCLVIISAARRARRAAAPRGMWANLLEFVVVFIRDEIARPAIGTKEAGRFLPYLLTLFFFILTLNLLGMIPGLGSPTGSIAVTAVMAAVTFLVVVGSGMQKMGVLGFLKAQVPHVELSPLLAVFLIPMLWGIEIFGLVIKHFVLAIRLFANMFGGHLVLAAFLAFAGVGSAAGILGWGMGLASFMACFAFSVLELGVALLQAYIFTFLAALFIGAAQRAH